MAERSKYETLKQISVLTALDTATWIAGEVLDSVTLVLSLPKWLDPSNEGQVYITWTIWALRLLVWSLTLAALSRLSDLRNAFGKARIWYLFSLLAFIAQPLGASGAHYRYPALTPLSRADAFFFVQVLIILAMITCLEEASLCFGKRVILFAGADLLETFGLEEHAMKNRRCGNRLLICAAARMSFLLCVFAVTWISLAKQFSFFDNESIDLLLCAAVSLWCLFLAELGNIAFQILAASRMKRTYLAIRELTE